MLFEYVLCQSLVYLLVAVSMKFVVLSAGSFFISTGVECSATWECVIIIDNICLAFYSFYINYSNSNEMTSTLHLNATKLIQAPMGIHDNLHPFQLYATCSVHETRKVCINLSNWVANPYTPTTMVGIKQTKCLKITLLYQDCATFSSDWNIIQVAQLHRYIMWSKRLPLNVLHS